VIGNILEKMLY